MFFFWVFFYFGYNSESPGEPRPAVVAVSFDGERLAPIAGVYPSSDEDVGEYGNQPYSKHHITL